MVLLESAQLKMGIKAPSFDLPGIDGENHKIEDYKSSKILVVVIMCNHCPYVQGVIHRLIDIQKDYADKGIQLVGINANESDNYAEDSFEKMPEYAKKWGLNFPYLRDKNQKVAKAYKAQCTPDIFVYNSKRELVYHGRVDDNWQEEEKVTKNELRLALDAILEGKDIEEQNPSIGCSVKWQS